MKYESLMLGGLFLACLLTSSLVLGAMLQTPRIPADLAAAGPVAATVAATPCALPADGVICPRLPG